jgi:hypothetical protein
MGQTTTEFPVAKEYVIFGEIERGKTHLSVGTDAIREWLDIPYFELMSDHLTRQEARRLLEVWDRLLGNLETLLEECQEHP